MRRRVKRTCLGVLVCLGAVGCSAEDGAASGGSSGAAGSSAGAAGMAGASGTATGGSAGTVGSGGSGGGFGGGGSAGSAGSGGSGAGASGGSGGAGASGGGGGGPGALKCTSGTEKFKFVVSENQHTKRVALPLNPGVEYRKITLQFSYTPTQWSGHCFNPATSKGSGFPKFESWVSLKRGPHWCKGGNAFSISMQGPASGHGASTSASPYR
ncbi:MAG TPA: hypothetical protein PKD61_36625 [Polyangiaceae bacterium]|nr:hypothetical protein [Polyangiaceae bacterium]